jgi:hypothetical protein
VPSVENKTRASADVIQPRSLGGNADKERASAASFCSVEPRGIQRRGNGPKNQTQKAP